MICSKLISLNVHNSCAHNVQLIKVDLSGGPVSIGVIISIAMFNVIRTAQYLMELRRHLLSFPPAMAK